jgi:hypothetical protein
MLEFSHKAPIFIDANHQSEFNENGFVVLPFYNAEEVQELLALFNRLHPDGVTGFYTTTFMEDVDFRNEIDQAIQRIGMRSINRYFKDYKLYCGSFIVKAPGPKSELILHQDMSLVDEQKFTGTNIWSPLVDLTPENGAIEVLKKSHRIFQTYRGASLPDIYDGCVELVKSYMEPMHLQAGEALIFDQSMIHYSPPNLSQHLRPTVNTFITHRDAKIQIAYRDMENQPDKVELFAQADNFMTNFKNFGTDIFARPSIGRSLGYTEFDFPKLTPKILEHIYGPSRMKLPIPENVEPERQSFLEKVKNWIVK